jgi:hypothetical protein
VVQKAALILAARPDLNEDLVAMFPITDPAVLEAADLASAAKVIFGYAEGSAVRPRRRVNPAVMAVLERMNQFWGSMCN